MGLLKKEDIKVLNNEKPEGEVVENVTAEVVENVSEEALLEKLKRLEAENAEKDKQLLVLGSLTKRQTRGEVLKEEKGSCGTIKIYNMRGENG